ncbi:carbohydrate porin [Erythrobacter sp. WH158]|uniref:Carbohydrate porin n=1 Tax=Erythrobacter crassostreae TaxID=2828328 RepID=A0A9X1F3Q5_9SPHN|nr:carbohydrate porin [Erythrobacter crassostrea]
MRTNVHGFAGGVTSALALTLAPPALAETPAGTEFSAETFELASSGAAEEADSIVEGPVLSQDAGTPAPPPQALPAPPPPKPVDLRIVASQFVDVPVAGDARNLARYAGRIDGYLEVRGSYYGGSDNLKIKIRPEYTWGETSNGEIGLIPGNTALFRPEGAGDFDLSASIEYKWKDGTTLEAGKINVLDISGKLPIVASDGHFGFQNLGLALPPTAVVPNTLTGVALQVPKGKMIYRLWVFDPDSQYQRTGFETKFESGVGFLASAAVRTTINKLPGVVNFAVVGSTRDSFAVDILPRALTPPPQPFGTFGNESGELAIQLSAYQFLKMYPEARGKGWGVLARFQASTGDPTFLDYSGYFGISGNPRFRPQDRFGLAYFQYSLTDELVDDIAFRLGIEDEKGVEAFYTYEFAKGFGLTANVQVVDSAIAFRDTGVTVGARLTTQF